MDAISRFEAWRLTRRIARLQRRIERAQRSRAALDIYIRALAEARLRARVARIEVERLGAYRPRNAVPTNPLERS